MNFKSVLIPIVLIVLTALTSGCASITGNTKESISVQTLSHESVETRGAACELANSKGKWFVNSPGSVTVTPSNDDMQVICNKQGSEPGRARVVSVTKGAMFGNILLGGGVGAIIDHNSGAAYEYPPRIQVMMGASKTIEMSTTLVEQPAGGTPSSGTAPNMPAMAPPVAAAAPTSSTPLEKSRSNAADARRSLRVYVIPYPR